MGWTIEFGRGDLSNGMPSFFGAKMISPEITQSSPYLGGMLKYSGAVKWRFLKVGENTGGDGAKEI